MRNITLFTPQQVGLLWVECAGNDEMYLAGLFSGLVSALHGAEPVVVHSF